MAVFAGQFVVTVWILSGLVLRSNARVLTKPCSGGEFIAVVNSSHLFGLPVECHDACVVLAASRDSVAACNQGMQARTGWTLCETSTPEALVLQDSEKHLCVLLTTQQHNKNTPERLCTGINVVNSDGCHDLKDNSLRHRRNTVIDESRGSADGQRGHSVAIIVSSAITVILLVLVSFLCVGGNKNAESSASPKAPVNAVQEDSTQNATAVNQRNNHLDSANQTTVVNQNQGIDQNQEGNTEDSGKAETADPNQHLYQNVNVQKEAGPELDHDKGLQLADQNQDHQPVNQHQGGQLEVQLVANQNEELGDQNEEPQDADQNEGQANAQDQAQQPADQDEDQAAQEAANGNQQQDPEKTKIPYGVVTIHSDQSNATVDNNNYAEVRNEDESIQDITYDRVNDDSEVIENGYSTVVRDKPTQQQPRRDRMYESVDEAFDRETKPSEPAVNSSEDGLEQDDTYEQVPDTFRQKVSSFSQQAEAPKLPPMNTRTRKPSDDPAVMQHRASSSATLPSSVAPPSPLMRARLFSTPAMKSPPGKTPPPPSFPAPAAPPPTYPAPNPPSEYDDDDDCNALYARPEPTGGRTVSYPQLKDNVNLEEARKKASTLPVKATLSYGGPRSPASLGPLPELPKTSSEQPEQEEQEDVEPGYDTTEAIKARQDYDHVESGKTQEQVIQDHDEQQPSSPQRTSSTVQRDGKGYALPTKRTSTSEENYAVVNLTQKRLSQRKKKATGGAGKDTDVVKSLPESSPPPTSPPPLDPELVDEDLKQEPSVPPRLPQSEELVEPDKNEPPYAKVNKKKVSESDQTSATAEVPSTVDKAGDDEIDPYAAVDIVVMGNGAPQTKVTPSDREYDTIDNVMSPPGNHNPPVNVTLSELEGDYACVRSDATISASQIHHPGTDAVTTTVHDNQTPADTAAHGETLNNENTTATLSSPEELSEL